MRRSTLLLLVLSAAFWRITPAQSAIAPGGFVEKATSGEVRARLTRAQIQALLPARGPFTFPLPYATQGVRLTNAADCGGQDCVVPVGYSYWANMNNHVGSDSILIFLGMDQTRGGSGPTLLEYDKIDDTVTVRGPLFDAGSRFRFSSGEGWYFSATLPTALYVMDGSRLLRYDVLSRQFTTVFDAASHMGAGYYIWQTHSSSDDRVHIATIRSSADSQMLGCIVYQEDVARFSYYPERGVVDECHLDRSGRYLVMLDNVDGRYNEDNRIIDIQTGQERTLLDQDGAVGHADVGHGYIIGEDDWNALPGAVVVWRLDQSPLTPQRVYAMTDWGAGVGHLAHLNAKPGTTPAQNFACSSNATRVSAPRANEIVCYRLDTSMDVLVVAPVMTDLNASGGGDDYFKTPKGNLDVSGEYFLWTSNMASERVDAFLVKVPSHRLAGPSPGDDLPPVVSLTSPLAGATVSGSVIVSALATDSGGVAGVQFRLDGAPLGGEDTTTPYSIAWNTGLSADGQHSLSAVARDASGNTATTSTTVIVANGPPPPAISGVAATSLTAHGASIVWSTSRPADTQVEYGLTTSYGLTSPALPALTTSHTTVLGGLLSNRLYHYRVRSKDAAGALAVSGDFTFATRPGLAAIWSFDETGPTAMDGTPGRRDGALMNGAGRAPGAVGGGLVLDGIDDYVRVPPDTGHNAYPITVSAWVRTSATGLHGLVNKYAASSLNGWQIFTDGGRLCAWYFRDAVNSIHDGTGCTMPVAGFNDGLWHHVAFVVDAGGGRLYVDGTQRAGRGWTGLPGPATTGQELSIGRYPGAPQPHAPGAIDEVRIHNYALTAAEVRALATVPNAVPPAVALTSPATGASVSGPVPVSATAVDLSGVAGVRFFLDGVPIGNEDTSAPYSIVWDTAAASNGQHVLSAVARDTSGNTAAASATVTVANGTAPMTMTNVLATAITPIGATITWRTSAYSDTQVEYGFTSSYGLVTSHQPALVLSHAAVLTGLASGRVYHYRVRSRDASGALAVSADRTFTTRPGIAGIWTFEEGGGPTAADGSAARLYNGTLMNGAARTAGALGAGIAFDGVDDHVIMTAGADAAVGLNAYPITVSAWVRTSATGLHGVVNKYTAASLNGWQIFTEGGRLCAWYFRDAANGVYDGTSCTMAVPGYNDGQWHHVALVVDAGGGRLYVDGTQRANRGWTGTPGPATTPQELSVARYPGVPQPYLPGAIDEIRIHNYALSATEVRALYNLRK